MENEACLAAIRNQYNTLTKTERQIADYILANSSSVVEMSVADLAAASAAAGSAVIRFCKTIGYTGFSQFRITLAMELASRPAPVMPLLTNSDTSADAARKVFDSSVRTLQRNVSVFLAWAPLPPSLRIPDTASSSWGFPHPAIRIFSSCLSPL